MIRLYNSKTLQIEPFKPLKEGHVDMYVCGPTVYNYAHIGNARPMVVFDVLKRLFEAEGYTVTYVSNFTDVDDKIINRAIEENTTEAVIAQRYIDAYQDLRRQLITHKPDITPRVTETMDGIIAFIKDMVDNGSAYVSENGDVYFSVDADDDYGEISHQNLDMLEAGARIDVNQGKRNPYDFALWKKTDKGIQWDSPWGKGRPGWHTECVVMINQNLGEIIDIHGGGMDLKFPHHENEIAQSECCNGVPFAKYWMHNGYINVDNVKMSKSLGNFFTVRDVAEKYGYEPIRYLMISSQYRSPINYSVEIIEQCKASLVRLYTCRDSLDFALQNAGDTVPENADEIKKQLDSRREQFCRAMDDDLNTADGIAAVFELVRDINVSVLESGSKELVEYATKLFDELTGVLGLVYNRKDENLDAEIEALIAARQEARKAKNWAEADRIRDELKAQGIILEDTPQGVKWHRA